MQFLGLLSTSVATGVIDPRKKVRRILVIVLYSIVEFGFYMGLVGYLRTSKASYSTVRELATACRAYDPIRPGFEYIPTHHPFPSISFKDYVNPFNKKGWKFGGILFGFILVAIVGLVIAAVILTLLFYAIRAKQPIVLGLICLALTIGTVYCTAQLEYKRDVMKSVTGPDFEDNQWGFGQIIALFLWAPLLIQSAYCAIGNFSVFLTSVFFFWKKKINTDLIFGYHRV
jgi:hypothetical protein